MWERADKSSRAAQDFADQHALTFHAESTPALPSAFDTHPFSGWRRSTCVAGQWRGRTVQRFVSEGITVELLALPRPLPRIQVVHAGIKRGAMGVGGLPVATGNPEFDARLAVYSDDPSFVSTLLDPAMQEALLHPAFSGRSLTIDADVMYLWTDTETTWDEARVRFEFLSVLIARIPLAVWDRFDRSGRQIDVPTSVDALFVPEPEVPETNQWEYVDVAAPMQVEVAAVAPVTTAPSAAPAFEGAFLPGPAAAEGEYENFAVAPISPY